MRYDEISFDIVFGVQKSAYKAPTKGKDCPLRSVKRLLNGLGGYTKTLNLNQHEYPGVCDHDSNVSCFDAECPCYQGETACRARCGCASSCGRRIPGCDCVGHCTVECPCRKSHQECGDECGCNESCPFRINEDNFPETSIVTSTVDGAGRGVSALHTIEKGRIIGEYSGEVYSGPNQPLDNHPMDLQHFQGNTSPILQSGLDSDLH